MTNPSNPVFRIQCHGGCLHGYQFDMKAEQMQYNLFGHKYEATGRKLGDHWVYVKAPKSKLMRLGLLFAIRALGRDPRLDDIRQPIKVVKRGRNDKCYCGSGRKFKKCHGSVQYPPTVGGE